MADYTLREIPNDLHRAWKSSAALRGWSMKDYCYVALQRQIEADIMKKEPKNDRSGSQDNVEGAAKGAT